MLQVNHTRKMPNNAMKVLGLISTGAFVSYGVHAKTEDAQNSPINQSGKFVYKYKVAKVSSVPNWVVSKIDYTTWVTKGGNYACSAWAAPVSQIPYGDVFQQTRMCSQDMERTVTYTMYNKKLNKYKTNPPFQETKTIKMAQYQSAVGQKDYIIGEDIGAWSDWGNVGAHYQCDQWTPTPDTKPLASVFQQTRNCLQDQVRTHQVYDVWKSGNKTKKRVDSESQSIAVSESREAVGAVDFIDATRITPWTAWVNSGSPFGCSVWSPSVDSVNLNQSFEQSRNCQQTQTGSRDIFDVWKSGKETLNKTENRTQDITVSQTQNAVGTKDFIKATKALAWSEWSNDKTPYACSAWVKLVSDVAYGTNFQQTRNCSQDQIRTRTVNNVWESGKATFNKTEKDVQTILVTQTQNAVGTKNFIKNQDYDLWSTWVNVGSGYDQTVWSPDVSTVKLGDTFTQTRNYSQNQERTRKVYDVWADGSKTVNNTEKEQQTVTLTESQSAIGTKNFIDSTFIGDWGTWSNQGGHYDCGVWSPTVDTVNLDQTFSQSRSCSQNQTRTRTIYDVWADGSKTPKNTETGNQTIQVTENQSATGTKDYIVSISTNAWATWENNGAIYNCTAWSPSASTIDFGTQFTQTRNCSQPQKRTRTIDNVWKSGKKTLKTTEQDTQIISVTQTQSSIGQRNFITSTETLSWGAWLNNGAPFGFTTWTPDASTVDYNVAFTQTRNYSQPQTRTRTINNVWADGTKTLKNTETESRTISQVESKQVLGTHNIIVNTANGPWGGWSNTGVVFDCAVWTPAKNTVNLGDLFEQTRSCSQKQQRTRTIYDVWADGTQTAKTTETENKTISVTQKQNVYGEKDYITGVENGTWGLWSNTGNRYGYTAWTPDASTVHLGDTFTQTRSYSQDQLRSRNIYNVWKSGAKTVKVVDVANQTLTLTENRTVTGTQDYITGTTNGAWSAWSNTGSPYDYSTWSPDVSTVNLGQTFTQTRTYKQKQTRSYPVYNVWKSGKQTLKTTVSGTQIVTLSQSQSATGTKDYVTGTIPGAWSAWSNSGGLYECGTYSPATSTVNLGQVFTQTATCKQNQTHTRTIYNVWKSGAQTAKTTESGSQVIDVTGSRSATGTKDYVTGTTNGAWSAWSNVGGGYDYGAWSPATSTVKLGDVFTQTRTYKQNQTRSYPVYNVWKSGAQTYKTSVSANQTLTLSQSQSATGTQDYITGTTNGAWSAWSNVGGGYSYSAWSPDVSTVNLGQTFTQTRTYKQNQTRSYPVYNVWKSGAKTYKTSVSANQTLTLSQSQSATGTKDYITGTVPGTWSAWSNSGGLYQCGSYSPTTSSVDLGQGFYQSATCKQNQSHTRTIYNVWKSGRQTASTTESGSQVINVTDTRYAVGTKDYITGTSTGSWSAWSNSGSGYDYGVWSPATSTVNLGQVFTQTRSYRQDQSRYYPVYNDWKSGAQTFAYNNYQSQTVSLTQSQSATGTKNYISGSSLSNWSPWVNNGAEKNCEIPYPAASTVNQGTSFTQYQVCYQPQTRSQTVYNVWADGSTTVQSTNNENRDLKVTHSSTKVGTKVYNTGSTWTGAWSAYRDVGKPVAQTSYSPYPSYQKSTYTQYRTMKTTTQSDANVYYVMSDGSKVFKETIHKYSSRTYSQGRSNTYLGQSTTGSSTTCTSWTNNGPSEWHYVEQTRTCTTTSTITYNFTYGSWSENTSTSKTEMRMYDLCGGLPTYKCEQIYGKYRP